MLERNRRPQLGEIAGIRAKLLSASSAVYDKNVFSTPPTGGPRKVFHAIAGILFSNAQAVLVALHAAFSARREEAEKLMRQMLLIALQKGTFYPVWNSDLEISQKLNSLWQSFMQIVEHLTPDAVLVENVPDLPTWDDGAVLSGFLQARDVFDRMTIV